MVSDAPTMEPSSSSGASWISQMVTSHEKHTEAALPETMYKSTPSTAEFRHPHPLQSLAMFPKVINVALFASLAFAVSTSIQIYPDGNKEKRLDVKADTLANGTAVQM